MHEPPSASEHPSTWKFDFPIFHPVDLAAWRRWLEAHHDDTRGVWVASWRKGSGREAVPYPALVEQALCFGWIDSTVNTLDDERALQLMTPREAKSGWTRLNRQRVADQEAKGLMTDAGRRAVDVAKANGWWTLYDAVEDLLEPDDLAAALDAAPAARTSWGRLPALGPQADAVVGHQCRQAGDPGEPDRQDRLRGGAGPPGGGLTVLTIARGRGHRPSLGW